MHGKIGLYYHTIRYLKPEQIFWRIGKHLGSKCALKGVVPSQHPEHRNMFVMPELDYDAAFLNRFSVEELMHDRVTFLHETEDFSWEGSWHVACRTSLWHYNLHYFEYLHPLTKRYLETGDPAILDKTVQMIRGWIRQNPQRKGGAGWSAYTISLRLTNWIAYISTVGHDLDGYFRGELEGSMFEQYVYLSKHLEKDLLGNHFFENLKTLVLCSLFFCDEKSLPVFLRAFREECRAEILTDGMHFELSPMYHKIVLEGLLRVVAALRKIQQYSDTELNCLTQNMLDAAYTMEDGLERIPLFNDSGDNVAKSLDGILAAAKNHLHIIPIRKNALPQSGYYFFGNGPWRLIVDAGLAGPDYIPGHSHCDAMSFELYRDGIPYVVNCGTYAYQCPQRHWYRSTEAHNTVQVMGIEQSEIWSDFRLARRSKTRVLEVWNNGIRMEMMDYKGHRIKREILLRKDSLCIKDCADGVHLQSYLHSVKKITIDSSTHVELSEALYAPEYGLQQTIYQFKTTGLGSVELVVSLT